MIDNYEDIIDLEHFVSKDRRHMSNYERAAQFAPFAALNGFSEDISEASRFTDRVIELSDEERDDINMTISIINQRIKDRPRVRIKYFIPDDYKEGGYSQQEEVVVKSIDPVYKLLCLEDKRKIDLYYINEIELI